MRKIAILCNDPSHPVMDYITTWSKQRDELHTISVVHDVGEVHSGDFLFLISCTQIVRPDVRARFRHCLVIHASDLPEGRGWSPQAWSVLCGDDHLTVSLLEAADPFDSGRIFCKRRIALDGTELFDALHAKLYCCSMELLDWALEHADRVVPHEQVGTPTYWPRRQPEDSRIDPHKSIGEQFDLLRICDQDRFPAFMDFRGRRYRIRLTLEEDSPHPSSPPGDAA